MWHTVCVRHHIFQLWNKEYIDILAKEIKLLIGEEPALEVAAGDGMLSHWLREHGVDIKATDAMSGQWDWDLHPSRSKVEKLDAIEAIRKYKPRLVVVSWIELGSTLDIKILEENPEFVIIIGERRGGCTGSREFWEVYEKKGYTLEYFDEVDKFNICRSDSAIPGFGMRRHSETALFRFTIETRLKVRPTVKGGA